jgi:predicted O-methyltransferase YrrM
MNPLQRLGPYLHSLTHSHESVWELLLSGSERRTAERDAERLRQRLPFVGDYPNRRAAMRAQLSGAYSEYVATVSPDPIAISLPLAVFLGVLCDGARPSAILDLGSGFSSYVFRAYARAHGAGPEPLVLSVDQSRLWLDQTGAFLERHQLDRGRLSTWDELVSDDGARVDGAPFDLILQDIATLGDRLRMLDLVIGACRVGGMIVIDDMHVPSYRRALVRELDRRGLTHFSLRAFTRKRLRYAYLVLP